MGYIFITDCICLSPFCSAWWARIPKRRITLVQGHSRSWNLAPI